MSSTRVGVFGWGIVAPQSPNIDAFARNLSSAGTWLCPFNGFGPDNFLVGYPEFQFEDYQEWIDSRFAPRHFRNLKEKMDLPSLYAIGAFIQSLEQNPGMEEVLRDLGSQAHVYVGTGLGSLDTIHDASIALYKAQRRWNRYWAQPERNSALREHKSRPKQDHEPDVPPALGDVDDDQREEALDLWRHYWASRSPELREYLTELAEIDGLTVEGEI